MTKADCQVSVKIEEALAVHGYDQNWAKLLNSSVIISR